MHERVRSELGDVVNAIVESYDRHEDVAPVQGQSLPNTDRVACIADDLLRILFPGYYVPHGAEDDDIGAHLSEAVPRTAELLETEIWKALWNAIGAGDRECHDKAAAATVRLFRAMPAIREVLATDIQAAYDGDPAATSFQEIILAYPCIVAISTYRLAHVLYDERVPLIPRMMTEHAHSRTGIDIHPGARIGRRFFIDHGTGVVIGETTEIGDNVKIYQGVTLGARSFPKDEFGRAVKGIKRHPTIRDNVTIYAGATILGGDTEIGAGSTVGGNVWLTRSVPAGTTVVVTLPHHVDIRERPDNYEI